MSARTDFAVLRVRQIGRRMSACTAPALEAIAAVVLFSTIGLLLAWRG